MYIIDIIPLASLPRPHGDALSYYHWEPVDIGVFVSVKFGKRAVDGVVTASKEVKNMKLVLKKQRDFVLRNIDQINHNIPRVCEWQIDIAKYIADRYFAPLGICLKHVLPKFWTIKKYQQGLSLFSYRKKAHTSKVTEKKTSVFGHAQDYLEKIKKTISAGRQVLLLVPENTFAKYFENEYRKFNPSLISSSLSNREHHKLWENVYSGKTNLVVGTRMGLFLPFSNLGLIIIDEINNYAYKSDMTPRYKADVLAKYIAFQNEADVTAGDTSPLDPALYPKDTEKNRNDSIVDMVREIRDANRSIFSRQLQDAMLQAYYQKKQAIIYVPRRGYASYIKCHSCQNAVQCTNCSTPMALHKDPEERLICHKCNFVSSRLKTCPTCKSYNLKSFGIGTQKIKKALETFYSYRNLDKPNIFVLDSDLSNNDDAMEENLLINFFKDSPSVLISTNIILSHKYSTKVELIGIINADTLLHFPQYDADYGVFTKVVSLREMSNRLIVQTYVPDSKSFGAGIGISTVKFLENEVIERKKHAYPPFTELAKLTYGNTSPTLSRNEANKLDKKLEKARTKINELGIIGPYEAFIKKEKGRYMWHILLKSKPEHRRYRNELLHVVPADWKIDIEPINIL